MSIEKNIVTQNSTSAISLVTQNREKLQAILPEGAKIDRYVGIMQAEINRNPDLASCHPASLVGSMLHCARLGLEPGVLNKIHLVPFNNSKKGIKECTVIIGYEGLIDLALRTKTIEQMQSHLVYEKDTFEVSLGGESKLVHRPLVFSDRGKLVGTYAIAFFKSGATKFEVMSIDEIEKIASKSKSGYIWKDHFGEMARKTVLRRLCKHLEKTVELSHAVELENLADTDQGQGTERILLDAGVEYERPNTPAQNDEYAELKQRAIMMLTDMPDDDITAKFARTREAVIDRMIDTNMVKKCMVMMQSEPL